MKKLTFILAGGVATALSLQSCQTNVDVDHTATVDSLVNVRMVSVIDSMNNVCLLRMDSAHLAMMDSLNITASTSTTTTTVRKTNTSKKPATTTTKKDDVNVNVGDKGGSEKVKVGDKGGSSDKVKVGDKN